MSDEPPNKRKLVRKIGKILCKVPFVPMAEALDEGEANAFIRKVDNFNENGHPTEIAALLQQEPHLIDAKNKIIGWNALHVAKTRSVAELLYHAKPSLMDETDADGDLPIHYAAMNGRLLVLQFLLRQRPSSLHAPGYNGRTPLLKAFECGQLSVVPFLFAQESATLDARDGNGQTALHVLAEGSPRNGISRGKDDDVACAEWILQQRPSMVHMKDSKGETPLDVAKRRENPNLAALLQRAVG